MIGFAAPLGWLALAAIVVPIVIHLIRRRAARDIPFAALDWLTARTPPRRQWRLDERWLLAVRLLLIASLAALLAELLWRPAAEPQAAAVYVMPGVDPGAARAAVDAPLADWHWLAPGFPAFDQPAPVADPQGPISLLRELDRALPAGVSLTVIVPEQMAGLDGERLRIGRDVVWRSLPVATAPDAGVAAALPFRIAIRADATAAVVARALIGSWRAAGVAIEVDDAPAGTPIVDDCRLLILSGSPLDETTQARVANGLIVLLDDPGAGNGDVLLRDPDGQALLRRQRLGRGQILALSGPLDPSAWPALRDPQLPAALLKWLRPPVPPPDRAPAASVAPLRAATDASGRPTMLAPWLVLTIALLWLLERVLATWPRRASA